MTRTTEYAKAARFATEAEAVNAGEDFCYANFAEFGRACVNAAELTDDEWIVEIVNEDENLIFLAASC